MEWKDWIGKRIFIKLKSGDVYSGNCTNSDNNFISMIDKFGANVAIAISEIVKIVDEGGKNDLGKI